MGVWCRARSFVVGRRRGDDGVGVIVADVGEMGGATGNVGMPARWLSNVDFPTPTPPKRMTAGVSLVFMTRGTGTKDFDEEEREKSEIEGEREGGRGRE